MTNNELIARAMEAASNAYIPYSGFRVGAALLTKSGRVYLGCNIENASFSPTCCAERVAFFKAISEGERAFEAIAIVGGKEGRWEVQCPPCGVCRQVMSEFCDATTFRVILGNGEELTELTLADLLPYRFEL